MSLEWILGVRPHFDGLLIDPCIPTMWDKFQVKRYFRNAVYMITVENPDHTCKGVRTVTVDGTLQESNMVPVFRDGKTHEVCVVMGK